MEEKEEEMANIKIEQKSNNLVKIRELFRKNSLTPKQIEDKKTEKAEKDKLELNGDVNIYDASTPKGELELKKQWSDKKSPRTHQPVITSENLKRKYSSAEELFKDNENALSSNSPKLINGVDQNTKEIELIERKPTGEERYALTKVKSKFHEDINESVESESPPENKYKKNLNPFGRKDSVRRSDINILKFLMTKKKEEQSLSKIGDECEVGNITVLDEIINHDESPNNGGSGGQDIDINDPKKEIVFEVNNLFDHYNKKLTELKKNEDPKFVRDLRLIHNLDKDKKQQQTELDEKKSKKDNMINFALIIEGSAISICLDPDLHEYLWKIIQKCRSLICCRCNPLQKAEVVKYVKGNTSDLVLAIGDGGNDVNMITVI